MVLTVPKFSLPLSFLNTGYRNEKAHKKNRAKVKATARRFEQMELQLQTEMGKFPNTNCTSILLTSKG